MTPLSDALIAAQQSALRALEKAYVAGQLEAEAFVDSLNGCGVSDPVDVAFLLAALDVLREWGVSEPAMTQRVAAENEPASDKQIAYMAKLFDEHNIPHELRADPPLTKVQAAEIIDGLKKGNYSPEKWRVPF